MDIKVRKYTEQQCEIWDEFIENEAINGTFLQSRLFLNYHKQGRFEDASLMFVDGEKLLAVCPACVIFENGKKIFYSHMGSSYGGIVYSHEMQRVEKMSALLDCLEVYLQENQFAKCILRQTMNLLCKEPQDILDFLMFFKGYTDYKELNIYIDYEKYLPNVIQNFSKMKKRNTKKCIRDGFTLRQLCTIEEITCFHNILIKNLQKYGKTPVHSVDELMDLKKRFGDRIEFYGAFLNGKMLAGTMVFLFQRVKCAHTQYLAADLDYNRINPMTFIYYKMAELFQQKNYRYLSWGIATEHLGEGINYNLANTKEEFGSQHIVQHTYEKSLEETKIKGGLKS